MRNRKTPFQKKIIYGIVATGIFGLLLAGFCFRIRSPKQQQTYSVVVMGDSLVAQCREDTSVPALLQERLGKSVYNAGFGGTCLALQNLEEDTEYASELLNMVSLSKAILAGDFGAQQTVRSRQEITDYFADTVDTLAEIDFNQVEVLVLSFGLNDYHAAIPMEDAKYPQSEYTFKGALRSVVTELQGKYPGLRIVLMTPTFTWYRSNHLTCEEYDPGNGCLEEYVMAELELGRELDVEVLDLYHDFYSHETWEDWETYTEDGLHPNEYARELIAQKLAELLEETE